MKRSMMVILIVFGLILSAHEKAIAQNDTACLVIITKPRDIKPKPKPKQNLKKKIRKVNKS